MLEEKKAILSIMIVIALMLCSVTDVMGQQYMELLEKAVTDLAKYRNPFGGLMPSRERENRNVKFVPVPGLDKKDVVPFLIDVLKDGPRGSERLSKGVYPRLAKCYAALSLGAIKDSQALKPLVEAMRTEDKEDQRAYVAHFSAVALGLLGDSLAMGPLVETLADKRPKVRVGAAKALGWLVGKEGAAMEAIRRVAETDPDMFVRVTAQRALGQIESRLEKLKESKKEEKE